MANNFAAKICSLLSQIRVHINIIIIQITSIKYDITLTTLSFFIFCNVLPHDMTKNPVKFCFSSQIFLKNFQNKRWRQSIFSRRPGRYVLSDFRKKTRLSKKSPLNQYSIFHSIQAYSCTNHQLLWNVIEYQDLARFCLCSNVGICTFLLPKDPVLLATVSH